MINVDLRRYGTDKDYEQFINGYISGADIDETPLIFPVKGDKPMKRVFLSLPMHGRKDDEVLDELIGMQDYLEKNIFKDEDFEVTHNMLTEPELDLLDSLDDVKHKRLLYLSAAITKLSQCDYALFAPGWKGANGCQIEYMACRAYGVKTIMM